MLLGLFQTRLTDLTWTEGLLQTFLILFLIALNAFFVASEFAFVRIRKTRVQELLAMEAWYAKKMEKITNNLDRSMSSTQLGITLASIALGFVGEEFFISIITAFFDLVGIDFLDPNRTYLLAFIIGYFFISYLHVVLGELVPKSIAIQYAESTAKYCAIPLDYFMRITSPLLSFFVWTSNSILRLIRIPVADETHTQVFSEEEIKIIIEDSIKKGELEEFESSLIYNILDFTDTPAKSIITPRYKVSAVNINATLEEIITRSKDSGFSRFPVYKEKLDNILGFVHIKDVIASLNGDPSKKMKERFDFENYMRDVIVVHEAKPIDDLLKEMQLNQIQVAILVDEWGSFEGIVTIEDIVEAIVGPILDEFDDSVKEKWITKSKKYDNKYQVDAQIPIDEFNHFFAENDDELLIEANDSVTLAGFLLEMLESKIPRQGEIIVNHRFTFKILQVEGNRIENVEIQVHPKSLEKSDEEIGSDENE